MKERDSPSSPAAQATNVLLIKNLVRPFTMFQIKELLSRTGTIVENGFWMDRIKSKCYVEVSFVNCQCNVNLEKNYHQLVLFIAVFERRSRVRNEASFRWNLLATVESKEIACGICYQRRYAISERVIEGPADRAQNRTRHVFRYLATGLDTGRENYH